MKDKLRCEKMVIVMKIIGGVNVIKKNIVKDLEGLLLRLKIDYVDVYTFYWLVWYMF